MTSIQETEVTRQGNGHTAPGTRKASHSFIHSLIHLTMALSTYSVPGTLMNGGEGKDKGTGSDGRV